MENGQTFAELISDLIELSGYKTVRRVAEVLQEKGLHDVDFRRVSDYKNGNRVPPFRKASNILKAMDYEISDDDLDALLFRSREASRNWNIDLSDVRNRASFQMVKIDFDTLMEGFESESSRFLLNNRVRTLYGDDKFLSKYVNDLIRKDLTEFVLDEEE